MEEIFKNNFV